MCVAQLEGYNYGAHSSKQVAHDRSKLRFAVGGPTVDPTYSYFQDILLSLRLPCWHSPDGDPVDSVQ